jgi:hypothetical protein
MIGINIASFSTFWDFHNFMVFEEFCVLSAKLCGLVPGGLPLQRTNVSNLGRLCRGPKQRCWTSFPAKKQNMLQIESGSNLPGLFHHFGLFSPFWRTFRSDFGPFLGNLATPITSTPGASPVSHRQLPVSLHRSLFRRRCGESAGVRQGEMIETLEALMPMNWYINHKWIRKNQKYRTDTKLYCTSVCVLYDSVLYDSVCIPI